jgi:hypothetical protein
VILHTKDSCLSGAIEQLMLLIFQFVRVHWTLLHSVITMGQTGRLIVKAHAHLLKVNISLMLHHNVI